jgi:hypothetical protein
MTTTMSDVERDRLIEAERIRRDERIATAVAALRRRRRQVELRKTTARAIDAMTDWIAGLRESAIEGADRVRAGGEEAEAVETLRLTEAEVGIFIDAMLRIGEGARDVVERNEVDDALLGALAELSGARELVVALAEIDSDVVR